VVEPAPDPRRRVWAKSRFVWIRPEPDGQTQWIGFLWFGGSVPLRAEAPRSGPGCQQWYAIEPRGYVCVDGTRATLDADDPVLQALRPFAPKLDTPWPHHYGWSKGLKKYRTPPTAEEQRQREVLLADHLARVAAARAGGERPLSLADVDLTPATAPLTLPGLPSTIHEPRDELKPNSTVAWSSQALVGDRTFLLAADMSWVPKDRVAVYPDVKFRGLHLDTGEAKLPLAFFRGKDRPKYRRADAAFVATGQSFARLSFIELTGQSAEHEGEQFLETREPGVWIKKSEAVVPAPRAITPWGAPVGATDTVDAGPPGRRSWIEASVWEGWLIAYEGTRPVFVTLISPGRGGTPVRGKDPIETASTPTGTFKITGKFATATMEAPGEYIHSDVPWTQNFSGPHALHAAYWHDEWGNRKSGGCVNVSPIDGKWLYEFTDPKVPEGWHGVRWLPSLEPATTFVVHD
jgi:hypothetical protein